MSEVKRSIAATYSNSPLTLSQAEHDLVVSLRGYNVASTLHMVKVGCFDLDNVTVIVRGTVPRQVKV